MVVDNECNFPHKLLSNSQFTNIRIAFANNSATNIRLSKDQLSKMIKSGGFICRLLGPLLKTRLPLIKNVIKPLGKNILVPLGLTAAPSAAYEGIHKEILGSGHNNSLSITLATSNNKMEDNIKMVK